MYNSIYPGYGKYYPGLNNRQITRKQDDEKSSQQSQNAENSEVKSNVPAVNSQNEHFPQVSGSVVVSQMQQNNIVFPNGEKSAIDYTQRRINITQVLKDFQNTANAIGAPDEIKTEVQSYLALVENQSKKEVPNEQIIKSNLKNASQILDEYITDTLKKPSTVVENWVDALFLQQIDYKSPIEETYSEKNADVFVSEKSPFENSIQESQQVATKNDFYVPEDKQLKNMFIQAKKFAAIDNNEKALHAFQTVADYAEETGDVQTAAIAYYEQGLLYDKFDRLEDALYSFDRASKGSSDNNIKARAHLSMGKIYDDFINFEPAVEHYCAAVSFSGESDNLNLQTKALTDLTRIHTERYDRESAFMFMDMSNTIANETKNNKLKGMTFASNANCCSQLNEKARALEYYGKSAELFVGENYYSGLANDYSKAADIMLQYGNKAKAKKLLSKAFIALQKCNNPELKQEVVEKITSM
ncbi:hypothetical protein IJD44_07030 [bacterium]|nr:hypothetical protein [bacterium]